MGFAALVSVGNEADLSIGEFCASTLDDPGIDGYVLFLETMRNSAHARPFASDAAKRGKPVMVYKLGRSRSRRGRSRRRTPARWPAKTTWPTCSSPSTASRASTRSRTSSRLPDGGARAALPAKAQRRRGHDDDWPAARPSSSIRSASCGVKRRAARAPRRCRG